MVGLQKLKWLIFDCCRKTNHLRYIWTDPLCWFSIDRSIIIIKCTRKGIYKQHLLCNTPLLKLNQLESGRHIPDTSHVHSPNTLNGCDHRHTMAEKRWELYVLAHHFTLNRLGGYPRTSDNPFQGSEVLLWHSSTLQRITFHHGDAVMYHRSLIFFIEFRRSSQHRKYERVQIENKTDHHLSFGKAPYL